MTTANFNRPRDTIDDTLQWLTERKENCIRIAGTKSGTDRAGWIEDGAYFGHAISLIERAYDRGKHQKIITVGVA